MKKPSFVYVIYVHATAEAGWGGLLDPEFTRRYWMHENTSDWKPGSGWTHRRTDPHGTVDIVGKVLESEPPRRLVLTWAPPSDAGDAEKTSLVTFEIAPEDWPRGPWISLRVAHSDLEPDSEMLHSVSWGWPALMSALKTLLESPGVFGVAELPRDERDRASTFSGTSRQRRSRSIASPGGSPPSPPKWTGLRPGPAWRRSWAAPAHCVSTVSRPRSACMHKPATRPSLVGTMKRRGGRPVGRAHSWRRSSPSTSSGVGEGMRLVVQLGIDR